MNLMKAARKLAFVGLILAAAVAAPAQPSFAQSESGAKTQAVTPADKPVTEHTPVATGAIRMPLMKPDVDQLGEMSQSISDPDKAGLFFVLFFQVLFSIILVLALFMHWPLFGRGN